MKNYRTLLYFMLLLVIVSCTDRKNQTCEQMKNNYDATRIQNAMIKAKNGGKITLAYIGGSITAGYAASEESKKWANLVTQWWKEKFPQAVITMINAGIGGTGSNIGTFRVKKDVLSYNPDFIMIEFAVNDSLFEKTTEYMEGMVRQVLADKNQPGLMMLFLKDVNGMTAQKYEKPVALHYKIPAVSFADLIDAKVAEDSLELKDIFIDGLHPLDIGMKYISGFIIDELEKIYSCIPANGKTVSIDLVLPAPLKSDIYQYNNSYTFSDIEPAINAGWTRDEQGWSAQKAGNEVTFTLNGKSIALLYSKHNDKKRGMAEVWVDNEKPYKLESYWEQTWGPATLFHLVADSLSEGEHTLHIKIINDKPNGSEGNYFRVLKVLTAGNE